MRIFTIKLKADNFWEDEFVEVREVNERSAINEAKNIYPGYKCYLVTKISKEEL